MELLYYEGKFAQVIDLGEKLLQDESIINQDYIKDITIFIGLAEYETKNRFNGIRKLETVDLMFVEEGVKDYVQNIVIYGKNCFNIHSY